MPGAISNAKFLREVTIWENDYNDLLRIRDNYNYLISIKNKTGASYRKAIFLKEFDEWASKEILSHNEAKRTFAKLKKQEEALRFFDVSEE